MSWQPCDLVEGLLRHQLASLGTREACSRVLEQAEGAAFIQPSLSSTESTMRCCLLVGVSMKRGAAFLRAVPQIPRAAVRPCALTQNNHAIIFVAIAKNEGKVAKVVPS